MAVICNPTDAHLYSVSTNFTRSDTPYSITVWINAVWSSGLALSFIGMYDGGVTTPLPTAALQIGTRNGLGDLACWTYGGAILVNSANGAMTDNIWALVTYTFDGTTHQIYKNETLLATTTTMPIAAQFTQIYINGYPPTGTANETATYSIDSYNYYNRALSAGEVQTIASAEGHRHGIEYGLLAHYEFDELPQGSAVATVYDYTALGNNLLPTGAGTPTAYTYTTAIASSNNRPVQ